ncbi:glycoside hydrolase family 88 protein [Bacteroides sp. 519]|uniref:glycoside hydrolase family 88 protein n=1 Tax=Bacteroides sp. 519 TaxID=2302937 RepID=UPI0013D67BBA|nr:glycoside hydrolase family 88 protein [Bacteroides sp. 519]NDV57374.1 glucuronyl hydrolase [Bacteroides sp. 519]
MQIKVLLGSLVLAALCGCQSPGKDLVKDNFTFSGSQLSYALTCADSALAANPGNQWGFPRLIPRTEEKDGSLRLVSSHDWCCGFFPANLWLMYEYTGEEKWKQAADRFSWSIEDAKFNAGSHDLGFMIYCPFGNAYRITGDDRYKEVALQAAKTLSTRYNPAVGCIRSWDFNKQRWQYPVIIDNMMNLELLFWATQTTGDSIYHKMAVSHADRTLENHFRPDHSSYHVINYDTITGSVISKETLQGYSHESVWSRGQAWGLYGFAMSYRFTNDPKYLTLSRNIADLMLNHPLLPEDMIPYWDMSDPAIPNVPRDVSAACIMASGLYELSKALPIDGSKYKAAADRILQNLSDGYRAEVGTHKGFLLLHSTGNHPSGDEVDVPISYADYYYLEALLRKY